MAQQLLGVNTIGMAFLRLLARQVKHWGERNYYDAFRRDGAKRGDCLRLRPRPQRFRLGGLQPPLVQQEEIVTLDTVITPPTIELQPGDRALGIDDFARRFLDTAVNHTAYLLRRAWPLGAALVTLDLPLVPLHDCARVAGEHLAVRTLLAYDAVQDKNYLRFDLLCGFAGVIPELNAAALRLEPLVLLRTQMRGRLALMAEKHPWIVSA